MNNRQLFKELKQRFLELGGTQKELDRMPNGYSLAHEAQLRAKIRLLKSKKTEVKKTESNLPGSVSADSPVVAFTTTEKKADLISDYPPQLHPYYLQRKSEFLKACSLKMSLNELPSEATEKAFDMQWQIWKCFELMDEAGKHLDYWKEHKRFLPNPQIEDYSGLTDAELILKRNRLRSNRSNRVKTIQKLEADLKKVSPDKKLKLQDKLNQKKEDLNHIKTQIEHLDALIKQ